jgi:spore germination protein YaaH
LKLTSNLPGAHLKMPRTIALLITILLAAPTVARAQQPGGERLFYVTSSPDAVASFEKNARSVSIVGPQSYRVDAEGNLSGEVPASILAIARKHKVPVMPLIVNPGWNLELFHKLVNNQAARATLIASMVSLGKQHGFWGWQFDFEQIHVSDRDSLSRFYREAAEALHKGASHARWEQHGVFEYAWIEDAKALAPKLELQKRYGLRGISVWRIGQEDPAVWTQLAPD